MHFYVINNQIIGQTLESKWILDFTSSSPLYSPSLIKHAVGKTVVVETIVTVKAAVTWTEAPTQSDTGKLSVN